MISYTANVNGCFCANLKRFISIQSLPTSFFSQRSWHRYTGFIYTTIKTTRVSVTEADTLDAAGWAWSLHGKQTWTGNYK